MNQALKNIFTIAKKAIYQSYTSYLVMFIGLIFAILGAKYNETFIDKPFYVLTIVFLVIGFALNLIFTYLNLKQLKKEINNLTILKEEYYGILKGAYLYPLFVWNKLCKITKNVIFTLVEEINNPQEKVVESENILFETERLIVRNLKQDDLETIFKYRNNEEINYYQTYDYLDKPNLKKLIEKNKNVTLLDSEALFAVCLKENRKIIGEIYISYKKEDKECYIGFTIDKPFQHQGYAYESVSELLVQLATKTKNINFICTVYEKNINSIKLIEKLEFKKIKSTSGPKGKIFFYKKNYN